jgi:hypothetical protein
MEPLSGLQALSTGLAVYERLSRQWREWFGKQPDTPAKQEAVKELEKAEDALELAKLELAKGFKYPLCQRHFPPGIKLDIREDIFPKWQCSTCGDITPHKGPEKKSSPRESWVRRTTYF